MTIDRNSFYEQTMHTPDSPERAAVRAALREISKALIPLHRQLIDIARAEFSTAYGDVLRTTEMVQLLTDDPFFAWLKPLTSLIVDIDEMVRKDFGAADVSAIADRLGRLFGGRTSDAEFAKRYFPILQRDVQIAMAHAAVRRALGRLTNGNGQ